MNGENERYTNGLNGMLFAGPNKQKLSGFECSYILND